jgi:dTDP-4-amino-4,6-dideoxygalactose transaminase
MLDLSAEVEALWEELNAAVQRVLRRGQFVLGPEVEALEQELAAYLGVRHTVALNSGTDALLIGLEALGVGPGDEVITTPFTFFATAEAVSRLGATPIFVDVEEDSFNLNPALLEGALSARTKAVLPVHLFGRPADMDALMAFARAHGLKVLEDCAQSFGARCGGRQTGSIGDAGAFSFYPTKNLGAYGDGGLLATDDDGVAETARLLRNHGSKTRYLNERLGYNSRLDELQAAILRVKLPQLDGWNAARRRAAQAYGDLLGEVPHLTPPRVTEGHVFHQYTVRLGSGMRDAVREQLSAAGIGTAVYYPVPLDRLPLYARQQVVNPVSEHLANTVLSLPLWPGISTDWQARVAAAVRDAMSTRSC